ncbi:MAG: hypothetical protein LUH10_17240 [Tannerellaceae bacterium]|nr:hypothetical protein [Tannerellaceae bacterium]
MKDSRTKNSQRNIVTGLIQRGISILMPFINRTIILWILGAQYQGLSSLFNSILQVLNMAELGMSSAIVYSMYKPIAEGNRERVNALLNYFKKAYYVIGLCILSVGVLLLPFLPHLISGSVPGDINIYALYCLYLFNTVISYFFFAYKNTIFQAHQRSDVTNNIQSVVKMTEYIVQFLLLIFFKNYYLYVIVVPIFTLINNLMVRFEVKRLYPQYDKPYGTLDKMAITGLKKQISGLMINKLSDTARNSFDSVIISSLLGLVMVAVYSNYYYIYSSLYSIMLVITNSVGASIGDSIAKESVEKNYNDCLK